MTTTTRERTESVSSEFDSRRTGQFSLSSLMIGVAALALIVWWAVSLGRPEAELAVVLMAVLYSVVIAVRLPGRARYKVVVGALSYIGCVGVGLWINSLASMLLDKSENDLAVAISPLALWILLPGVITVGLLLFRGFVIVIHASDEPS
jgi:hypothetical protein